MKDRYVGPFSNICTLGASSGGACPLEAVPGGGFRKVGRVVFSKSDQRTSSTQRTSNTPGPDDILTQEKQERGGLSLFREDAAEQDQQERHSSSLFLQLQMKSATGGLSDPEKATEHADGKQADGEEDDLDHDVEELDFPCSGLPCDIRREFARKLAIFRHAESENLQMMATEEAGLAAINLVSGVAGPLMSAMGPVGSINLVSTAREKILRKFSQNSNRLLVSRRVLKKSKRQQGTKRYVWP